MPEVSGKILRITFKNPETGYTVARLQAGNELHTIVGKMPDVGAGQELTLKGEYKQHPQYGRQLEVAEYEFIQPSDLQGIAGYLGSGLIKGIGPKTAQRIVDALGKQTLQIIEQKPEMLQAVPGIGRKSAARIVQGVRSHGDLREFMVFLQEHGLAVSTSLRIWNHYGPQSLHILKTEPHRLAQDMRGIGFLTADRIARQIGLPADHISRLQAGLLFVLHRAAEEGHVCLPLAVLIREAALLLEVDEDLLHPLLSGLEELISCEARHPLHLVYLKSLQVMEGQIAGRLLMLRNLPGILSDDRVSKAVAWAEDTLRLSLSNSQMEALHALLTSGLGVLSGGPGTGKTTLVQVLLAIARRMGMSVALAAPTGRAAKRLGESCNCEASTLHRLLEYKEGRLTRNRNNPLEYGLVVVDESSMLDTWLTAGLLNALGPATRLLLVGDAAQLPSVGPGLILQQIIESKVAEVAYLREIFRQKEAGLIVSNAHRILHGLMPVFNNKQTEDFFFFAQPDPYKAAQLIVELASKRLPEKFSLEPAADIQVLAPMHRGGLGCSQLNLLLRQQINSTNPGEGIGIGDKVIQSRNNYDLEVFNGDIGFVEARRDNEWLVRMGERLLVYNMAQLDDLSLAYAITIHKAQGSEYPVVLLGLGQEHHVMLNRSLLYTAITRGRKLVVVVGHPAALRRAVNNQETSLRHTGLKWRIDERL